MNAILCVGGVFVGAILMLLVLGLCAASGRADDLDEARGIRRS